MPQFAPNLAPQPSAYELAPETAYGDVLAGQARQLPEVEGDQAAILQAGRELITEQQIQPSLFDDPARSLVFTAVAHRWAAAGANRQPEAAAQERGFLLNALTLLAYEHSPKLEAARPQIEKDEAADDGTQARAVYDRYTDPRLSQEIQQAIGNGLLDGVKSRLGITPGKELPYEVRVLSIDPNGANAIGLAAPFTRRKDLPTDRQARSQLIREERQLADDIKRYKTGLVERAERMANELGKESKLDALAWVTTLPGSNVPSLCITMPFAEKLLYPELTASSAFYHEGLARKDQAVLEHEYTHTQGMVNLDSKPLVGISLEERRAEHFSGDQLSYKEIKAFFVDISIITGFDVVKALDRQAQGATTADIYTEMAAQIGLDGMLEALLVAPQAYVEDPNCSDFLRSTFNFIGGYDAVSQRLVAREIAADNGQAMHGRVTAAAAALTSPKDYYGWLRRRNGMKFHVVPNLIGERYQELQAQRAA